MSKIIILHGCNMTINVPFVTLYFNLPLYIPYVYIAVCVDVYTHSIYVYEYEYEYE